MAGWNGSGTFTKTHSWVADAANSIKIRADRHDQNDTDFTNGINNCLTKDGQNAATADLPMGTYNHTNVGNATARNEYLTMGQAQDQGGVYYVTTGTADAYVVTPTPALTAYASGTRSTIKIHATNTGTTTVNISGVGTANIVKNGSTHLGAGDLTINNIVDIVYDGSNFQLLKPILGTIATQSAASVAITGGSITGITDIAIADGGTGASTASAAFAALKQAADESTTGVVELATAAEILTGSSTTLAMSPGRFAGNKSLAASGYYKFPGGLIVQWGHDTGATGTSGTTSFPVSFASACYAAIPVKDNAAAQYISITSLSTSNFGWVTSGSGTGLYYVAIGV